MPITQSIARAPWECSQVGWYRSDSPPVHRALYYFSTAVSGRVQLVGELALPLRSQSFSGHDFCLLDIPMTFQKSPSAFRSSPSRYFPYPVLVPWRYIGRVSRNKLSSLILLQASPLLFHRGRPCHHASDHGEALES